MEYVNGGDLLSYIRKMRRLPENTVKYIFKQIINAIHHLHSQNIIHRDIKLENILIDSNSFVKLCDFGVSREVRRGDLLSNKCGTLAYIAPEILRNKEYEGFGVDIWSAGVVLYTMLCGTVPFKAYDKHELESTIMAGKYSKIDDISSGIYVIIKMLGVL